jgi:hypothetical protein
MTEDEMSHTPEPAEPAAYKEGLIRIKEVLDASRESSDTELLGRAQQAVQKQVPRLATHQLAEIRWDEAKIREIPGRFSYVYAPTTNEAGDYSGVTVFFDPQGEHVSTVETSFTRPSATLHRVQVWNNGKLVVDKSLDEAIQPRFSWSVLNSCLSNAGIAWATLALIGTACAVACVGTAGAGCVACIALLSGGDGGVIGFCVGQAIAS